MCQFKDLLYTESRKWFFPFQTYATLTMLQTHMAETTKQIKIMERSLYSSRYVFIKNYEKIQLILNLILFF